jgi:hypothetical protein
LMNVRHSPCVLRASKKPGYVVFRLYHE